MPSSATRAHVAERRAAVLRLRIAGVAVSTIARQLGIAEGTVYADVTRALASRTRELDEAIQEYRAVELERLETMERAAWGALHRKHYVTMANGKVARHPDSDEPLVDDATNLAAINTLLRVQERRAKLLGLDAATKATAAMDNTHMPDVEITIARLFGEMIRGMQVAAPEP